VLLPSVSARREAFDDYCRERARELRASRIKKEDDPKEEFEKLLVSEVKSTRTSWTDFRRQFKKDRRFYGWGRDDREREKRFREFLKDLGESACSVRHTVNDPRDIHRSFQKNARLPRKRRQTSSRFSERVALYKTAPFGKTWVTVWFTHPTVLMSLCPQVKQIISKDPRYDAVGSSSLRTELFNTFMNARSNRTVPGSTETQGGDVPSVEQGDDTQRRKDRKAEAVKEREEKVKAERERVQATIEKSRSGLNREEGELQFRCATVTHSRFCRACAGAHRTIVLLCRTLLTDAIREPQVREPFFLGQ